MAIRSSEEGRVLPSHAETLTVGNITAGATADVACTADANFILDDCALVAAFAGPPLANLAIVGAWVSTESTGVITVRFLAGTGNVATASQKVVIQLVPNV
jgi:hypothetical protein